MINTCQLKRLAAALRSRLLWFSSNSDRLCKNALVSGSPWTSPWRMSKFPKSLKKQYKERKRRQLYYYLLGNNQQDYIPLKKWGDTHRLNAKLPSCTGEAGVEGPSWSSAVVYHSGIVISRPEALWSWYPRTMASRNLLAPLSWIL